jgi:hypothetical protein
VSELVGGAALVALFTVAVRRPPRVTAVLFVLGVVATAVFAWVRPEAGKTVVALGFGFAVQCAVVGWGTVVRHRRELVLSLRERAARAEAEAALRAERAQLQAREAIAREMHDVLGHRLSLLSVHAGALEYRQDAPAEDVARSAAVIRESAHQALQDLRGVIGVLRAPVRELPQPTFADLAAMVAESARAGMPVVLRDGVDGEVPDTRSRMTRGCSSDAYGVRTRVSGLRGQCPYRWTNAPRRNRRMPASRTRCLLIPNQVGCRLPRTRFGPACRPVHTHPWQELNLRPRRS